ncbi:pseudoazurin [Neorhizobium galegae]|uniref:pseudoazurin n=1 Tax=Neorhizobium galegae TaxID=399 RepID=UPI00278B35B8|nr:pseudoazurin [Neorhizobium galegae]MDQ0136995.1 pseudoazurin [Neorhizobium galegae]
MRKTTKTFTLATSLALFALPAFSAEIEVKMLNKGSDGEAMVFEPAAVKVQVGDTIRFVPVDKGHDVVSMPGLVPEGVAEIKGKISQEFSFTADKPGAYVFKCTPHFGMGMVAVIVVGDTPANLDAVRGAKMPKKAKDRLDAEIARPGL